MSNKDIPSGLVGLIAKIIERFSVVVLNILATLIVVTEQRPECVTDRSRSFNLGEECSEIVTALSSKRSVYFC